MTCWAGREDPKIVWMTPDNVTSCYHSLRKTVEKASPILVTLTSSSDSDVESSNVSLKENKPDGVNPNSNDTLLRSNSTTFERMKEKFYGFRQTDQL